MSITAERQPLRRQDTKAFYVAHWFFKNTAREYSKGFRRSRCKGPLLNFHSTFRPFQKVEYVKVTASSNQAKCLLIRTLVLSSSNEGDIPGQNPVG